MGAKECIEQLFAQEKVVVIYTNILNSEHANI